MKAESVAVNRPKSDLFSAQNKPPGQAGHDGQLARLISERLLFVNLPRSFAV
jgi:hypothetical protein